MHLFLRPARAVLLGTIIWTGSLEAQSLQPYQQEALDAILAASEPDVRPALKAQFEPLLAVMDRAQVEMMMAAFEANNAEEGTEEAAATEFTDGDAESVATPEDLEYNRAQYEPAIRKAWQAEKAFDDFVTAEITRACPASGTYAVFGSGWRYEVYPPNPNWPAASDSADLDVQIIGPSYAPQDGRYQFDFSKVKTDFDQALVADAINRACAEYKAVGEAFMAEAGPRIESGVLPDGSELEQTANNRISVVNQELEAVLQAAAPAANGALYQALLNGKPAR